METAEYRIEGGVFSDYTGKDASFTVPEGVFEIGDRAFCHAPHLEEVFLPKGLRKIGNDAFWDCKKLRLVQIKEGLSELGYGAFGFCVSLREIALPASLRNLGDRAFLGCKRLRAVSLPEGISEIGEGTFGDCQSLGSISLPKSLRTVRDGAFRGCTALSRLTLPPDLALVEINAFAECGVRKLTLPPSLISVETQAFRDCERLKSVLVLGDPRALPYTVFQGCAALTDFSLGERDPYGDGNLYTEDGKTLLRYAMGKKEAVFSVPHGVERIADGAFYYCDTVEEVILHKGVVSIGEKTFAACERLRRAPIPAGMEEIPKGAFEFCSGLEEVTLPESVCRVGMVAFWHCKGLRRLTVKGALSHVGKGAFVGCTALGEVVASDGAALPGGLKEKMKPEGEKQMQEKIMIASDIHGSATWCRRMLELYEKEECTELLLLGDILYHGPRNDLPEGYGPKEVIALLTPYKEKITAVPGNCDAEVDRMVLPFPIAEGGIAIGRLGRTLFLHHGHHGEGEEAAGADLILSGHTHVSGRWGKRLNPGSTSIPKEGTPHSAVVFDGDTLRFFDLATGEVYREERV